MNSSITRWIGTLLLTILPLVIVTKEARATVVEGGTLPYQAWVDEVQMPTPSGTITIVETSCPNDPTAYACTNGSVIWMDLARMKSERIWPRETYYHELGHVLAFHSEGHFPLSEKFANTYMSCALDLPYLFADSENPYQPAACAHIKSKIRQQKR